MKINLNVLHVQDYLGTTSKIAQNRSLKQVMFLLNHHKAKNDDVVDLKTKRLT